MNNFDVIDIDIINSFQKEIPLVSRPYLAMANKHNVSEEEILGKIKTMRESKIITRLGPMFDIAKAGGSFLLCAMIVPEERFQEVTEALNNIVEVAHNYRRDNEFNMWFVLACREQSGISCAMEKIESQVELKVYGFDKEEEYFVSLYLPITQEGQRNA